MIQTGQDNYSSIFYIPLAFILAYLLYRLYKKESSKKKSFNENYDEILKSEKYKVKGKFDSD